MGYIGRTYYEAARAVPGVQVVAAASERRQEIQQSYPELELFSYEDLCRDDRLDAILICLPTFLHEQFAIEAVANGRHVLCEKPLALDANSAARMLVAAKEAGVVFMVSQVLRFWPQYVRIQQLVSEGILGEIRSVSAYRLAKYPPWGEWFRDPAKSGGCLLDLQVHDMDFIFWIMGHPRQVQSLGLKSSRGAWDHVITSLRYADAVASIESSYMMPTSWPLSAGIRVAGSRGAVEYAFRSSGDVSQQGEWTEQATLYGADGKIEQLMAERQDVFAAQLKHFVACIENPSLTPVCPCEDSYTVMNLLSASKQSAETAEVIRF